MHNAPHNLLFEGNAGEAQQVLSRQIFGRKINLRADEFSLTTTSGGSAGDSDQTVIPLRAFSPRPALSPPPPNDAMDVFAKIVFMPRSAWTRRFISTLNVVPVGDGICGYRDSVNGDLQVGSGATNIAIIGGAAQKLDWGSAARPARDTYAGGINDNIAGASTAHIRIGGVLKVDTTAVGNIGAGADTLITYTVPADVLAVNGDSLEVLCAGLFANNGNTKQLRLLWGPAPVSILYDTTLLAQTNGSWELHARIIRTSATAQVCICRFTIGAAVMTMVTKAEYTILDEILANALELRCEGTSGAGVTDDVIQKFLCVDWKPASP